MKAMEVEDSVEMTLMGRSGTEKVVFDIGKDALSTFDTHGKINIL